MQEIDELSVTLSDLFSRVPEIAGRMMARGMLCPSCPFAAFHSLGDACREYGLALEAVLADLCGPDGSAIPLMRHSAASADADRSR